MIKRPQSDIQIVNQEIDDENIYVKDNLLYNPQYLPSSPKQTTDLVKSSTLSRAQSSGVGKPAAPKVGKLDTALIEDYQDEDKID